MVFAKLKLSKDIDCAWVIMIDLNECIERYDLNLSDSATTMRVVKHLLLLTILAYDNRIMISELQNDRWLPAYEGHDFFVLVVLVLELGNIFQCLFMPAQSGHPKEVSAELFFLTRWTVAGVHRVLKTQLFCLNPQHELWGELDQSLLLHDLKQDVL